MFNQYNPNERHHIKFDVVIKLLAPLSHIGESVGNQSNLKTLKITDIEGESSEVFVYSGNALRNGILRRRGFDSFLSQVSLEVSPDVHQLLFAGGFIDGSTGCDLELDKKIRQLLPPLSVLGGAKPKGVFGIKDAQMLQGRINIGDGILVCYESAEHIYNNFPACLPTAVLGGLEQILKAKQEIENKRIEYWLNNQDKKVETAEYHTLLEEWKPFLEDKLRAYPQWLTWNQKVRMDSLKQPELTKFLEGTKQEGQLSLLGDTAPKKAEKAHTQQMIMGEWLLQQGATLYSRWTANISDIEEGFIADALLNFAKCPYLGGKSNTGCGLVQIDIYYSSGENSGHWMQIKQENQIMSDRSESKYLAYQEYLQQYRELLEDLKTGKELKNLLGAN